MRQPWAGTIASSRGLLPAVQLPLHLRLVVHEMRRGLGPAEGPPRLPRERRHPASAGVRAPRLVASPGSRPRRAGAACAPVWSHGFREVWVSDPRVGSDIASPRSLVCILCSSRLTREYGLPLCAHVGGYVLYAVMSPGLSWRSVLDRSLAQAAH